MQQSTDRVIDFDLLGSPCDFLAGTRFRCYVTADIPEYQINEENDPNDTSILRECSHATEFKFILHHIGQTSKFFTQAALLLSRFPHLKSLTLFSPEFQPNIHDFLSNFIPPKTLEHFECIAPFKLNLLQFTTASFGIHFSDNYDLPPAYFLKLAEKINNSNISILKIGENKHMTLFLQHLLQPLQCLSLSLDDLQDFEVCEAIATVDVNTIVLDTFQAKLFFYLEAFEACGPFKAQSLIFDDVQFTNDDFKRYIPFSDIGKFEKAVRIEVGRFLQKQKGNLRTLIFKTEWNILEKEAYEVRAVFVKSNDEWRANFISKRI